MAMQEKSARCDWVLARTVELYVITFLNTFAVAAAVSPEPAPNEAKV